MRNIVNNEYIDNLLKDTNFKRLEDYKPYHQPIKFICNIHNKEFMCNLQFLKNKLKNGYGCELCYVKNKCKNNEYIDNKLSGTGIKRIGEYIGMNVKCEFMCLCDGYKWFDTPANVLTKYINKIKPKRKLNDVEIDKRLANRKTKRYGNMTSDRRCVFKCDICDNIWETDVYDVLRGSDCPLCKYSKNEKKVKILLEKYNIYFEYHKMLRFNDRKYYVDFYIPDKNIIIEYNGIQHYKPTTFGGITNKEANLTFIKQQKRDNELRQYCKENNIILLEIKYNENINKCINTLVKTL